MLSWFPPCLIFTVVAISEGLLIFGSKKKEKAAKKSLVNRTVIGSIFFGFFMGSSFFLDHGAFNPKGLIAVPLIAAGFGFPFYFLFTGMMKISEKYADKKMTESEDQDEE